jgi:AraC-like DNA-binding protein
MLSSLGGSGSFTMGAGSAGGSILGSLDLARIPEKGKADLLALESKGDGKDEGELSVEELAKRRGLSSRLLARG